MKDLKKKEKFDATIDAAITILQNYKDNFKAYENGITNFINKKRINRARITVNDLLLDIENGNIERIEEKWGIRGGRMAVSKKMKANRKTFTGVLRVYINKFNIPDGEWFLTADLHKFLEDERENYRKEKGIEVIEDYRKVDKYILEKYADEARRW